MLASIGGAVGLHEFEIMGIGLVATRTIQPEEILITVPLSAAITTMTEPAEGFPNVDFKGDCLCRLAYLIACAKRQGESCRWYSWLNKLDNVRLFCGATEETLGLDSEISLQRREMMVASPHLLTLKADRDAKLSFLQESVQRELGTDRYEEQGWGKMLCWGFGIACSRSFELGISSDTSLAVVPWVDYANHTSFSTRNCSVRCDLEKGEIALVSISHIQPGDQILICYGRKSNAELLVNYGFVLLSSNHNKDDQEDGASNVDDVFQVQLPLMDGIDGTSNAPFDQLSLLKLSFLPTSVVAKTKSGSQVESISFSIGWKDDTRTNVELGDDLMHTLRILSVTSMQQIPTLYKEGTKDLQLERAACSLLKSRCHKQLATIEQVQKHNITGDDDISKIAQVLKGEQRLITATINQLAKIMNSLEE